MSTIHSLIFCRSNTLRYSYHWMKSLKHLCICSAPWTFVQKLKRRWRTNQPIKIRCVKNFRYILYQYKYIHSICFDYGIFSTSELKAQVTFSNSLLSVVRLLVCTSVCLAQSILGSMGFKIVPINSSAYFQWKIITK